MTDSSKSSSTATVDNLLRQKRQEAPSATALREFDRSFPRKLMAAVARPRHTGRTLKVAGWLTPVVFGTVALVALGVAYFASPARAIANWEASATRKEYVVDTLTPAEPSKPWKVDRGLEVLSSPQPTGGGSTPSAAASARLPANHF
jgi:hypothetical protein